MIEWSVIEMGRITSSVGIVSGINTADIIDQLMKLEERPKTLIQTRIDNNTKQKLAYTDLQTRLTSIKITGTSLKKPSFFQASTATSSDENVLTATASNGAAVGSFQFRVARLVTAQQNVSKGFADFDSAKVGAGRLTIEMGGGEVSTQNLLSELNGGAGIRRGVFRITDRSGKTATIDTSAAVTLDDVVKKINTSLDVQVRASLDGDRIVLSDLTGKTDSNLIVQDLADGHAAADLGLVGNIAADTLEGTDIHYLGAGTNVAQLNDGRGIRRASTGNDLKIDLGDGSSVEVALAGAKTVGEVITAINTAGGTKLKAELVPGGNGIKLTDQSGGGGAFAVTSVGDSKAAEDLGLTAASAGGVIDGKPLLAGLGTVLLSSLKGGQGLSLGTISIKSRAAGAAQDIDLSGATTVADVIHLINDAGAGVTASLNSSGNGLQIVDSSGGTGTLEISGQAGTDLGLDGTFDLATTTVKGANLQRQWVSENSLLAELNGGKGVRPGKFIVTDSTGKSATVDLTQGNEIRLSDVISEINSKGLGVTASINANGDGLLLTDTAGGGAKLKVEDTTGTAAADLRIAGTAADGQTTIDGSYEKTIDITATDTLQDVQKKINDLNFGVTAQIINDGSGGEPYRLTINASNSGRNGRVVFDAGATNLDTRTLVEAQDAAVFFGGQGSAQPLLLTASRNQIAGVIKGVNIELHSVSDDPVNLSISRTTENVVGEINKFVENFNGLVEKLTELTKYDTETKARGLLLGETAAQTIQTELYASINTVVQGAGKFRILADIGLKLGSGAKLEFDEDKFNEAYAADPEGVQKLFSMSPSGLTSATLLSDVNNGRGIRASTDGSADFRVTLRDGSTVDVALGAASTVNDLLTAINDAGAGKLTAEIPANGNGIRLNDASGGSGTFKVESLNGSQAAADLGIETSTTGTLISGAALVQATGNVRSANAGIGYALEARINRLTDPVSGVVTRQNKTLDQRNEDFEEQIDALDKKIEAKRLRLEKQFANLESTLAQLQNQQQSIGQIQSISYAK